MSENTIARVFVNGVEVGSLPIAMLQQIKKEAKADPWLYLGQAMNVVYALACFFTAAIQLVPVALVVALFWLLAFDNASVSALIELFRIAPIDMVVSFLKKLSFLCVMLCVIAEMFCAIAGAKNFGLKNYFQNRVDDAIYGFLEVPVVGRMSIQLDKVEQ